jgi:transcription initiation factor IIE alpha subunit
LAVVGTLLPKNHVLSKTMYEAHKLLKALKMSYEQIHACPNGCVLFREELNEAKYCPKCKASRFLEVESSDSGGQKTQLKISA